jgi:asparagine synthase (glutamine-hydrolysing)
MMLLGNLKTVDGFCFEWDTDGASTRLRVCHRQGRIDAAGNGIRLVCVSARATPDVTSDQQLVVTPRCILVYTGRVDYREQLARLVGFDHATNRGDGDLLAAAYEKFGVDFPNHVEGSYSFVLVDRTTRRLVAARDALGIGQLFVRVRDASLRVASNLALMLAGTTDIPDIDRDALPEYFATGGLLASDRTVYRGIRRVPPGHVFVHSGQSGSVARYWYPERMRIAPLRKLSDCCDALRENVTLAISSASRVRGTLWTDLSGGLDSSLVTALAMSGPRTDGASLPTGAFSYIASRTPTTDESSFQQIVLARYPLQRHTVDIDSHMSVVAATPPPLHPSKAMLYTHVLNAAAELFTSRGVSARLTGKGGDVVFCGNGFPPLHLRDILRSRCAYRWPTAVLRWLGRGDRSLANLVWRCSVNAGASPRRVLSRSAPMKPAWMTPSFAASVDSLETQLFSMQERRYDSVARELQFRYIARGAATLCYGAVDDERHPLLSRRVVEFALGLPWQYLLDANQDRIVQRAVAADLLPSIVARRVAKATTTEVLLRALRDEWPGMATFAAGTRLADLGLVDPPTFSTACERLRHGLLSGHLRYFIAALTLEQWCAAQTSLASELRASKLWSSRPLGWPMES